MYWYWCALSHCINENRVLILQRLKKAGVTAIGYFSSGVIFLQAGSCQAFSPQDKVH